MRQRVWMVGATLLAASLVTGQAVGAAAAPTTVQVPGSTAVATAVAMAGVAYPHGAATAILSSGELGHLVDAATAAPLASLLNAPILLTASDSAVGTAALGKLKALGVKRVIVIGAVDNPAIVKALSGYQITGISGATRFDTAADVAKAVDARRSKPSPVVFVASANDANLTDALTVDPVAASLDAPVLLVSPTGGVPKPEQAYLSAAKTTYVVGAAASYRLPLKGAVKLAGVDRYTTADLVNQRFFPHPAGVLVYNQNYLFNALVAAPWAAQHRYPMVMVGASLIPGPIYDYLVGGAPWHTLALVGVGGGISPGMAPALDRMARGGI